MKKEVDKNYLAVTHPDIAKEAHGWNQTKVTGGNQPREWRCSFGHIWKVSVNNRKHFNSGCPFCGNSKVLSGFNDLATTHPEIAKEAHGWDPTKVIGGTSKKLVWKCVVGHIWEAIVDNRTGKNSNCPFCANQKVLTGFNDLATTHPEIAKEAHGWDPTKVIGGHQPREWKCSVGHVWKVGASQRLRGAGCTFCANQKVLTGFNDLATTHPDIAKEAHGWDPTKVITGTSKKLAWKCEFGHIWETTGNTRMSGAGCPSCAKSGFDANLDAYVYFMVQDKWEMYQIGITNDPETRLKKHKRIGFELLELRGPMDGHKAQELETAMLRYLKSQKADLSPDHISGKFDGYTECWTIDSYKVNNLKELIDKASEAGF
jgi:predicted GIY-YIG superfamily endonuclease